MAGKGDISNNSALIGESYDPDAEAAIALARREVQGPFPPSSSSPNLPSDGTYVETRPSKLERTFDILAPYVTEPIETSKRIMTTSPHILMGFGTPEETEAAIGDALSIAGGMGGASSFVRRPANSVGVFGGIKSLTADKPAIREAMKMESKGATPDEIWDNTGWFRGADGNWRYEIPDIGTTVNSAALQLDLSKPTIQPIKSAKLGDYLQHPRFFAAYPQFKNMDVSTMPGGSSYGGMYFPRMSLNWGSVIDPRIELNENLLSSGASQRDVLLHEIQHAIQQKEGFAPGTNIAAQSAGRILPAVKRHEEAVKSDPEMQELMSLRSSADYKKQKDEANDLYTAEYSPREKEIDASSMSDREKEAAYNALNKEYNERINNMFPILGRVDNLSKNVSSRNIPLYPPSKKMLTPVEAYEQFAGETEARNVQRRKDLKEEDLRGMRPWETQDYHYIDQLFPENDVTWKFGYASGGEVNDDDIDDALRIAKDVGGSASIPVMMEDAKGNKYDAQGNLIPPASPGPNPSRSDVTPQSVAAKAVNDPATYDAIMERYAIPDRDIAEYEALKAAVSQQPQDIQQMTHVGDRPRREMTIDMPLFGGEYSMGTAPYDVAQGLQGAAQTAYDFKTMPAYFFPATAPFALGADVLESRLADDPLGFVLNAAFTPQGASAARSVGRSVLDLVRSNPKATAAAVGAGAYLSPDEAEAGPERWFSKAMEVARALPMEKMTGQQALAMLRKSVSPEELRWTGADAFLSQQKQITKQDLVDYLKKNRVNTEDIILADRSQKYPYKSAEGWQNAIARAERAGNFDEAERLTLAWEEYEGLGGFGSPRYRRHSTLGGEDYKETLITLPTNEYGRLFQSGHWEGYPNVIGHIRTQVLDVTPPGANRPYKAFNVDEAQSDYAKEGREIGFSSAEEISKREEEVRAVQKEREKYQSDLRAEGEKIAALEWEAERQLGPFPPVSDRFARQQRIDEKRAMLNSNPDYMEAYSRHAELQQKNNELIREELRLSRNIKGVPSAPYVASTQNWTDLSVKKALDQAMDAGADYFTYTPGKAQAARYSLRNAVDELLYSPSESRLYGRKDGRWVFDQKVEPDKLSKYVGSSVADELLKQPTKTSRWYATPRHVLSGQQLELGGEGMIDYYDNIYKKRVEKVVKDATGKKVQWEVIPVQTADGPREQLGFRLTDDMKEARFSDFNKGGRVSDPVVNKALSLTRY